MYIPSQQHFSCAIITNLEVNKNSQRILKMHSKPSFKSAEKIADHLNRAQCTIQHFWPAIIYDV